MFSGIGTCFSVLLNGFWPVPGTALPDSARTELGTDEQQRLCPTVWVQPHCLEGTTAVRSDTAHLASVPENTAGSVDIQKVLTCSALRMIPI